ncbi:MAG: tRNA ligase [Paramarteilia canceri]
MVYVFDIIYYNGESLINKSLRERNQVLISLFTNQKDLDIRLTDTSIMELTTENIDEFFQNSIENGCEGLMIKSLDNNATYQASKRSQSWLKLKKDYLTGMGDSLDLVAVGAFSGTGKRKSVFGGFLLAVVDENGDYLPICKCGSGFNDKQLAEIFTEYHKENSNLRAEKKPNEYKCPVDIMPEFWFHPKLLWEVKAADYTLSPIYQAGKTRMAENRGISLRFPRFIRERDDKNATQATSESQLADMYLSQNSIGNLRKNETKEVVFGFSDEGSDLNSSDGGDI